jgi:hypothetical protein
VRLRWGIVALALLEAGWMVYDGTRALVIGSYFNEPIGPWRYVVEPLGIEPKSTLMESFFVVYGAAWLVVIVAYVLRVAWAKTAMIVAAVGSLWYIPLGTMFSVAQLALFRLDRRRQRA